jgi:hypothetical protein
LDPISSQFRAKFFVGLELKPEVKKSTLLHKLHRKHVIQPNVAEQLDQEQKLALRAPAEGRQDNA